MIGEPGFFWLLFVLVPILLLAAARYRSGLDAITAVTGRRRIKDLTNSFQIRWFFTTLAFVLSVLCAICALAGFRWGWEPLPEQKDEGETIFIFDISRSMLAEDLAPNRLSHSATVARSIVESRPGDSFGIVVFSGSGVVFLPTTEDRTAVDRYLNSLHPSILTVPGTDIAAGIDAAIEAFPESTEATRTLILFTDGGFLSGDARRAARRALDMGVPLHVVGAGGDEPVRIPLDGGWVVNTNGEIVTTRLRMDVVKTIAKAGSGEALRLDDPKIVEKLGSLLPGGAGIESRRYRFVPAERFRVFLVPAVLFLFGMITIRTGRWRNAF